MYISLYDLGVFFLFIVSGTVCVLLIMVLRQILGITVGIRKILDEHQADIKNMLTVLPASLAQAGELAATLQQAVEQTGDAVGELQGDFSDMVDDFRERVEAFVVYGRVLAAIVRAVFLK